MEIRQDELYSDIYGLYLHILEKGYTNGLSKKDFIMIRQLQNDISFDLIDSDNKWYELYEKLNDLSKKTFLGGVLHKYHDETINYLKENAPLLPLVLANDLAEKKTEYIKIYTDTSYMFSCQFHNENTPSMGVTDDRNLFYCFGCGATGSAITYLMEYENISYKEAIKLLADIYLIKIESNNSPNEENIPIIKKYQAAVTSTAHLELLERCQSRLAARGQEDLHNKSVADFYKERYALIDRINSGEYDESFTPKKPPSKVYLR